MAKKLFIIVVIILLIILGVILWSYFNRDEEVINNTHEIVPGQEISDEQLRNTIISLYYINNTTGEIEAESKLIDAKILLNNPYEEIINLWLKGPNNTNLKKNISKNVKINNISIEGECAKLDFSKEFITEYNGNENEESKLINCIVNTITEFTEINCVQILIDGEENQYLGDFNLSEKYFRINN